jgi:lipopolysaccharide/colanic/teichoic acid biosynthesis glycosyltransferase
MKRTLDVVCASIGLLALGPLLLLIAVAVWAEDRHSPFFLGRRVGRRLRLEDRDCFFMIKFRTMIPDAWKSGVSSTANGDRRITRVGSLLRRAKLDELPQLWNVLIGDMSLVGPRPQVEADVALYTNLEWRMLGARPGITDLASIVFSDEGSILAGAEDPNLRYNQIIRPWKSRLALLYIERSSTWTNLRIIGWTLLGALSRERALRGVQRLLRAWDADPVLIEMASRQRPLMAWPPPGAAMVVTQYPAAVEVALERPDAGRATHA